MLTINQESCISTLECICAIDLPACCLWKWKVGIFHLWNTNNSLLTMGKKRGTTLWQLPHRRCLVLILRWSFLLLLKDGGLHWSFSSAFNQAAVWIGYNSKLLRPDWGTASLITPGHRHPQRNQSKGHFKPALICLCASWSFCWSVILCQAVHWEQLDHVCCFQNW